MCPDHFHGQCAKAMSWEVCLTVLPPSPGERHLCELRFLIMTGEVEEIRGSGEMHPVGLWSLGRIRGVKSGRLKEEAVTGPPLGKIPTGTR